MPSRNSCRSGLFAVTSSGTFTRIPSAVSCQGAQPRVRFEPPTLEMGPVLPHASEGDLREVQLINEGAWDVEIFSLDFDKVKWDSITSTDQAEHLELESYNEVASCNMRRNLIARFCCDVSRMTST